MKKARRRQPQRVLIVVLQRIGDVLLATPIARSLKTQWPGVKIDFLVNEGTEGIISAGDGFIEKIILLDKNANFISRVQLLLRIFRRYDLAISTQGGDRSLFLSFLAAGQRASIVSLKKSFWDWKRAIFDIWIEDCLERHVIFQNNLLLREMNVEAICEMVIPKPVALARTIIEIQRPYVVVHAGARFSYKEWTIAGWSLVVSGLLSAGYDVVLSGGPGHNEKCTCEMLCRKNYPGPGSVTNLAGLTTLAELANVIEKAALYIGVDTAVTHLAAATGVPVLSIYGPTNPVKWAPWPKGYALNTPPFKHYASIPQKVGNVTLLQGDNAKGCVPCHQEGCEHHLKSRSQCLDQLDPKFVLDNALLLLSDNKVT